MGRRIKASRSTKADLVALNYIHHFGFELGAVYSAKDNRIELTVDREEEKLVDKYLHRAIPSGDDEERTAMILVGRLLINASLALKIPGHFTAAHNVCHELGHLFTAGLISIKPSPYTRDDRDRDIAKHIYDDKTRSGTKWKYESSLADAGKVYKVKRAVAAAAWGRHLAYFSKLDQIIQLLESPQARKMADDPKELARWQSLQFQELATLLPKRKTP